MSQRGDPGHGSGILELTPGESFRHLARNPLRRGYPAHQGKNFRAIQFYRKWTE